MGSHNSMIRVDGVWLKTPSAMTIGINEVSRSDAGRTEDALMHKNRVAQKVKISLSWNNPTPSEAHTILNAFNPEYVNVYFYYPLAGANVTKNFYTGDKTMPVRIWTVNDKHYESISFDIIER